MIYYPAGVFTPTDLCKPHIFEYHYKPLSVYAQAAQTGFPETAVANELTYERYRPTTSTFWVGYDFGSSKGVNYCAIAAHTLAGKWVYVYASATNVIGSHVLIHRAKIADNSPIVILFPVANYRYWQISVENDTSTAISSVGTLFFGTYLRMPWPLEVGFAPLSLSRKTTYSSNQSEGGNWLGRSVKRMGKSGTLSFKAMGRDWYRASVDPMILRARYKPFFYASNPFAAAWDVAYCWLTSDPKPTAQGSMLMDVSMEVEAHAHE